MKILVISDTHGKLDNAKRIVESVMEAGIKYVLHCGDYVSDARLLQKFYPELEVNSVYGNCDIGFGGANDEVIEIEGVSIYMTHGHKYGVKWGDYEDLWIDANAYDASVAICGHSHEAHLEKRQGILMMNPGSLSLPRDSQYPSYGILEIKNGKVISAKIMQIYDNGVIREHLISSLFGIK